MHISKNSSSPEGLLIFALIVVYIAQIIRLYEPYTFANFDPGWQIQTVLSIVADGDLDLRNQLGNNPKEASDQIALGTRGEWYCVHERLLPLMTVPFYMLFGINGALLFNALLALGMMLAVYRLAHMGGSAACAAIAAFVTALTLADWSYSYSVDVFGAFLLVVTLLASIRERHFFAGLLFSLSVVGRLSNVAAAPAFLYLLLSGKDPVKSSLKFAAAAVPVVLLFLVSNWQMFGGPLELSYFHQAYLVGSALEVNSQQRLFSVNPFRGIATILFDPRSGFIPSYPVAALAYVFGVRDWKRAQPRLWIACAIIGAGFLAFYSTYAGAVNLGGGMRHFLPVIALSALPLSCVFANFHERAE
jgi:hypothetical protein